MAVGKTLRFLREAKAWEKRIMRQGRYRDIVTIIIEPRTHFDWPNAFDMGEDEYDADQAAPRYRVRRRIGPGGRSEPISDLGKRPLSKLLANIGIRGEEARLIGDELIRVHGQNAHEHFRNLSRLREFVRQLRKQRENIRPRPQRGGPRGGGQ
jgi:hypothetical protein